ncbi:MAG: EAL domain-containing protein [bacterium]|nr:EAL domain-containing protein [bacterium]
MTDPLRILIIDDDAVDRTAIRRALKKSKIDAEITEIGDAERGLQSLLAGQHDCAFLDYLLPPSDGLSVLRSARKDGIGTPIVLLTGKGDEDLAAQALRAGASDYLSKDTLSAESLSASVRHVTNLRKSEIQLQRLASFPDQAPNPIIELTKDGSITYTNPAAIASFPELTVRSSSHPLLADWSSICRGLVEGERNTVTREITLNQAFFHLTVSRVPGDLYRIYALDISDRKRAEEQLIQSAFYDELTGLPNRALFTDRLGGALNRVKRQRNRSFAVLLLDLDRFKNVNDSYGHQAGDRLLVSASDRLQRCVRTEDTVSRFGGDEFSILVEDPQEIGEVIRIAERIQSELEHPFVLGERTVYTSASIGIALGGEGYSASGDVLRDADIAMYRAKAAGGAQLQIFDAEMHAQAVTLMQVETELRHAIDRSELRLFYQPIVELASGQLEGLEALIRWQHPERGLLGAIEFIGIAEESGLITEVDDWVLREACREAAVWADLGENFSRLSVSINISGRSFTRSDRADRIREIIAASSFASHSASLTLEITETAFMQQIDRATALLNELRPLGVRASVDDFGTGYSSLSYLRRLPLDALKIDRSFVREVLNSKEDTEIVRAIIGLAHNLGLLVIAEGIETREQHDRLAAMGCDFGQGYLFAKPLPSNEAVRLVQAGTKWQPATTLP